MSGESWKEAHEELLRLARSKGAYDAEEAHWLVEGRRARVHEALGYGTYFEYLERLFGYGPRLASEKLRVAVALAGLPAMREELATGGLTWSAVRELSRVAVAETEKEWIDAARGSTVRDVERMVSGHRPGDLPTDPTDPSAERRVLRFEVSGDTFAALREARSRLELEVGHALDDDTTLNLLAQRVLGDPGDDGRAPYQIAITVCEQCGRGTRDGAGVVVEVPAARLEAAQCDAQEVGDTHVGNRTSATQTVPPRVRRQVLRRDHSCCRVPGCRASKYLEVHHVMPRSQGGTHDPSNLILLCSAHHALVHERRLRVEGEASGQVAFSHADGTPYGRLLGVRGGSAVSERDSAGGGVVAQDAVGALQRLGFKRSEARRAVAQAKKCSSGELLGLVRGALAILGAATSARSRSA